MIPNCVLTFPYWGEGADALSVSFASLSLSLSVPPSVFLLSLSHCTFFVTLLFFTPISQGTPWLLGAPLFDRSAFCIDMMHTLFSGAGNVLAKAVFHPRRPMGGRTVSEVLQVPLVTPLCNQPFSSLMDVVSAGGPGALQTLQGDSSSVTFASCPRPPPGALLRLFHLRRPRPGEAKEENGATSATGPQGHVFSLCALFVLVSVCMCTSLFGG